MKRGRHPRNRMTSEAGKKYRGGEINAIDHLNIYHQSYGFVDHADFSKAARLIVMKMIALKINHPYYSAGYSMQYQVDLIEKYQDVEVDLKCECCGQVKDVHFMTIDHLDNNGAEHRKEMGGSGSGSKFISHMLRHGFNPKYKLGIMCSDCNSSLGFYGFCPHHPEIRREMKRNARKQLDSEQLQNTPDNVELKLCNLMEA